MSEPQGSAAPADPPALPAHGRCPASPELEKQERAINDGAHRIGEFLDWLGENGFHIAQVNREGQLYLPHIGAQRLIAAFYEIDLDRAETERRALLEYLRVPTPERIEVQR